jgi:hypothetical protein
MTEVEVLNTAIQLGAHPRPPVGSVVLLEAKHDVVRSEWYDVTGPVLVRELRSDQPFLLGVRPLPTVSSSPGWTGRHYWYARVREFVALPDGVSAQDVLSDVPWTGMWRSRARVVG